MSSSLHATPTHPSRCRAIVASARQAVLSTLLAPAPEHGGDRDVDVHPYGSLVAFASDARGRPLLLLSRLAEHTTNLTARSESSLLVCEVGPSDADPLSLGRVTLIGATTRVPDEEKAEARAAFLVREPRAATYVDFADFAFYRLEPRALRYVGGFGRMSWVTAAEYAEAEDV